jgi:hypothetical protein
MEEKKITISAKTSPLNIDQQYFRYHFSMLIPEEEVPFGVSVFFKGKYIEIVKRGAIASLKLIASMYNEKNFFFYVLSGEKDIFDIWLKKRHHFHVLPRINLSEKNKIIEHRINMFLKYADEGLRFIEDNITFRQKKSSALAILREVCFHPTLKWYFENEWSVETMNHCNRVSFVTLVFSQFEDIEITHETHLNFIIFMICHELGDFVPNELDFDSSKKTLNILQEKQLALDSSIIGFIQDQNELVSGLGKPNGKLGEKFLLEEKIFSIVNRFDHSRHSFINLTKAKSTLEAVDKLKSNISDFDPELLTKFINFSEKLEFLN